MFAKPVREESFGLKLEGSRGRQIRGRAYEASEHGGFFRQGIGHDGPVATVGGAVGRGRLELGGEPSSDFGGHVGRLVEPRFDPGEEAQRGIDEFAVEFAITGTDGAIAAKNFFNAPRKGAVAAQVRAEITQEVEE